MSNRSIIHVKKNSPTTIDFNLEVSGIENAKKTSAVLVIEDVLKGCDVSIKATPKKDNVWSVLVPNLKNFKEESYNVRLEVVVDGYHFIPASGKIKLVDNPKIEIVSEHYGDGEMLAEGINSGTGSVTGPETQVTGNQDIKTEFEPDADDIQDAEDRDRAESDEQYPVGQNDDEAIDDARLDGDDEQSSEEQATSDAKVDAIVADVLRKAGITPSAGKQGTVEPVEPSEPEDDETHIEDIASDVDGVEGPQLPFGDEDRQYDVKEAASSIIRTIIPHMARPATKGSLLSPEARARIVGDAAALMKLEEQNREKEEKNRRIREVLNPPKTKSTIAKTKKSK